ncbi:MAG TPA: PqqD family protein [Acidobacteriota bacterium]|jgi:hypothetical protein|nr:PqqD family protein [Acidobacteriota bacterium]
MDKTTHGTIVVAKDQVSCNLARETVILNFKSGVYYGLDEIGTFIWNLIQDPKTLQDVRDALLNEYQVEPERCESDLRALVQELAAAALIEFRDAPAA